MSQLKIGVVGPGLAFRDLHLPVIKDRLDVLKVTFIAATTVDRARNSAQQLEAIGLPSPAAGSVSDLLRSDVDIVLVTVPISMTADVVEQALDAGKHVLAEKPLATSTREAQRLLDIAASRGLALLVGENFRLQPDFAEVRRLLSTGVIGVPKAYFLNDLHFTPSTGKYAQTRWRVDGHHSGGYLVDGGTHIVAGMREMVGRAVVSVHGMASAVLPYLSRQVDTLLLNIQFEDAFIGHLALGYGLYDPEARHPKIYGTEGTLALMPDGIYRYADTAEKLGERSGRAGFAEEWDLIVAALSSGDFEGCRKLSLESINDLRVIEAGLESAVTGQAVFL